MFGFLGTIGTDLQQAASKAGDAIGSLVQSAKNDPSLGGLVQSTSNNIRTDLANAVADLGAGLTNGATKAIAPNGSSPLIVPVSRNTLIVGGVIVALVVVLIVVLWRKKA